MKDKVVIITGASSGIGRATALFFAQQEAKLVLAARSYDKLLRLENQIKKFNINVISIKTDVSKKEDCQKLIQAAVDAYNGIDILINNAGISMRALFKNTDISVLENIMNVNFWGTVYCTKYALPYLLESKGSVIGVSSIAGYIGLPARTGYSASKFAMHGFLEALRTENLEKGLHVMIACPGFTNSNIRSSALKADGSQQGESPRSEDKMMSAEEVAAYIYKGTVKRKQRTVLTKEGKLAVWLGVRFPRLMQRLVFNTMKKEPDSPLT